MNEVVNLHHCGRLNVTDPHNSIGSDTMRRCDLLAGGYGLVGGSVLL